MLGMGKRFIGEKQWMLQEHMKGVLNNGCKSKPRKRYRLITKY